ncbi:TadG family pilus assembly protein [Methylobacterium oryzae CBMB20]
MVFQARRKAQGRWTSRPCWRPSIRVRADPVARQSLSDNGYGAATATVAPGSYDASARGVAPGGRFSAGGSPANAVRVGLSTSVQVTFGRAIGLPAAVPLRVTGTAASAQFAAFTIGSGTLKLEGGIANALLGALLGAKLSLSVSDYDALAGARVDGLRVLDALGTSLNMQAANYTDIVQANASIGQVLAWRSGSPRRTTAASSRPSRVSSTPSRTPETSSPIGQVDGLGDAAALAPPRASPVPPSTC